MSITSFSDVPMSGWIGEHVDAGGGMFNPVTREWNTIEGPFATWKRETHVGLCIRTWERNEYDDSNFYVTVWNTEKNCPEDVLFGSTRFANTSYVSIDASPEIVAKYKNFIDNLMKKSAYEERKRSVEERLMQRKYERQIGHNLGINSIKLRKLTKVMTLVEQRKILNLLNSRPSDRNKFKDSLFNQVVGWMKEDQPKYNTPLSPKQISFL